MEIERRIHELRRLKADSVTLSFLTAHTMDFSAALLGTYFTDESKRIDVAEFHERLAADIGVLAYRFPEIRQKASDLVKKWVNKGILARRQHLQTRVEYYELTRAGYRALEILNGLDLPRAKATESRLAALTDSLVKLELETNRDKTARIAALQRRRDEIDREIERLKADPDAEARIPDEDRVKEQLLDIIDQAREVPADFLRVRDEFDDINRGLRKDLLESTERQEKTLNDVFLGIDRVHSSEAGQSFSAFYAMLMNEERQAAFDASVEALRQRRYFDSLPIEDALYLSDYSYHLQREALPVRDVMTTLSRNLRQFVQSRQITQFREMMDKLNTIQRLGLTLRSGGVTDVVTEIELPKPQIRSLGRLSFTFPESERTEEEIVLAQSEELDITVLRQRIRETEIDFEELISHVNDIVRHAQERWELAHPGQALPTQEAPDIPAVLEEYPATQGIASIVGLVALGMKHGHCDENNVEIRWHGQIDGVERHGTIPNYRFSATIT